MCPRLSELKQTKMEFGDYGRAMQGEWVPPAQKNPKLLIGFQQSSSKSQVREDIPEHVIGSYTVL